MKDLKIEYLPIDSLKPYGRNNKKHQKFDVDAIAKSIEKYGMNDPIGIWKNNVIIEGHGRLLACKQLGMDTVPCVRLDHLTDKERREYAILHNKTAELAAYDFDNLKLELDELDFSDFGDIDFGVDVCGCVESEDFIQDILNDKSFHSDNLDINKTLFVISFAFPKEIEEIVKPYLIKNKDEITQRLIQEAKENASMR